ncbi:hypothetical protein M430DRAFT_257143 [Amorphotheca resinae ATCC 22711]|uniref:Uncharacterized protein n=1 Tax=Amorphotheca resinae ATCC 22711 TaxID=857342 RepID=A0A2T3AYI6_AMORE|nr:hypothetical protein M430DRAFT_257143 [Amorphotheca resinae ATCC 22711]PSS15129.1 hypothetical protein M430DRAFT_257143 [Amorphotheca resinae ATCC 22711]
MMGMGTRPHNSLPFNSALQSRTSPPPHDNLSTPQQSVDEGELSTIDVVIQPRPPSIRRQASNDCTRMNP